MSTTGTDADLWDAYFKTRSIEDRNAIVERYMPLAHKLSRRFMGGDSEGHNFTAEELASFAYEGLISCVERFTPDRRACFVTFATSRVRGAIWDGIESVRKTRRKRPRPRIFRLKYSPRTEDTMWDGGDGLDAGRPGSFYADRNAREPSAAMDEDADWQELTRWMPPKEKQVLLMVARDGLLHRQIAERLGISESRVSQLFIAAKKLWADRIKRSAG